MCVVQIDNIKSGGVSQHKCITSIAKAAVAIFLSNTAVSRAADATCCEADDPSCIMEHFH